MCNGRSVIRVSHYGVQGSRYESGRDQTYASGREDEAEGQEMNPEGGWGGKKVAWYHLDVKKPSTPPRDLSPDFV